MKMIKVYGGVVYINIEASHWYHGVGFDDYVVTYESNDDDDKSFRELAVMACKMFDPHRIYEDYKVTIKYVGIYDGYPTHVIELDGGDL